MHTLPWAASSWSVNYCVRTQIVCFQFASVGCLCCTMFCWMCGDQWEELFASCLCWGVVTCHLPLPVWDVCLQVEAAGGTHGGPFNTGSWSMKERIFSISVSLTLIIWQFLIWDSSMYSWQSVNHIGKSVHLVPEPIDLLQTGVTTTWWPSELCLFFVQGSYDCNLNTSPHVGRDHG